MRVHFFAGAAAVAVLATTTLQVRGEDDDCSVLANEDGDIIDCLGNAFDCETALAWIGDGYCDDGSWGGSDQVLLLLPPPLLFGSMQNSPNRVAIAFHSVPRTLSVLCDRRP